MSTDALSPEIFVLPLSSNGLPDLLILTKSFAQEHLHAVVRAYIASSDPDSKGFWSERFNSDGHDALKWARLFALEKARQHIVSKRGNDSAREPKPVELKPFSDWETLSIHRALGFYPMLQAIAGAAGSTSFMQMLYENDKAYNVMITEQHYQLR